MEEEDIEECIKKVNAIDNGVMLFAQNMSQKFEGIKNLKKKYVDKLVDYKVFIGGDPSKEEKEKNFRDVEALARDFKNAIKSIWVFDEGSKRFIETIKKKKKKRKQKKKKKKKKKIKKKKLKKKNLKN